MSPPPPPHTHTHTHTHTFHDLPTPLLQKRTNLPPKDKPKVLLYTLYRQSTGVEGGARGATAPPLQLSKVCVGGVCTINEKNFFFFMQYVSHSTKSVLSMKQMLSSSIIIFASDCTRSTKTHKFWGSMPPDPPREYLIKPNHKCCPPPLFS